MYIKSKLVHSKRRILVKMNVGGSHGLGRLIRLRTTRRAAMTSSRGTCASLPSSSQMRLHKGPQTWGEADLFSFLISLV